MTAAGQAGEAVRQSLFSNAERPGPDSHFRPQSGPSVDRPRRNRIHRTAGRGEADSGALIGDRRTRDNAVSWEVVKLRFERRPTAKGAHQGSKR